jgi:hypothetical protein
MKPCQHSEKLNPKVCIYDCTDCPVKEEEGTEKPCKEINDN